MVSHRDAGLEDELNRTLLNEPGGISGLFE